MTTTVNISVSPGELYRIVMPVGVTATYNGEQIYSYFVAVEGVNSVELSSNVIEFGDISIILMMRSYYEAYDGQGGVWAYQPSIDRWTSQYSFRPEWMSAVGNRLVTFNSGKPYVHNSSTYNRFYGESYDSVLAFVHNEAGNSTKTYMAVSLEGDTPYSVHVRTEVPNVQSSDIRNTEFEVKEGVRYAPIMRDRLSPISGSTPDSNLVKGNRMRGEVAKFQVVFAYPTVKKVLKLFNIVFNASRGHNTTPQNSE